MLLHIGMFLSGVLFISGLSIVLATIAFGALNILNGSNYKTNLDMKIISLALLGLLLFIIGGILLSVFTSLIRSI